MTNMDVIHSLSDYARDFILEYKNQNLEQKLIDAIVVDFINYFAAYRCGINLGLYTSNLRDEKKLSKYKPIIDVNVILKALKSVKSVYIKSAISRSINRNSHMNECGGKARIDKKEASNLLDEFIEGYINSTRTEDSTNTIYAVAVYSELGHQEIKAYCKTRKIAERELKKYTDEWYTESPKTDDKHILKIEIMAE